MLRNHVLAGLSALLLAACASAPCPTETLTRLEPPFVLPGFGDQPWVFSGARFGLAGNEDAWEKVPAGFGRELGAAFDHGQGQALIVYTGGYLVVDTYDQIVLHEIPRSGGSGRVQVAIHNGRGTVLEGTTLTRLDLEAGREIERVDLAAKVAQFGYSCPVFAAPLEERDQLLVITNKPFAPMSGGAEVRAIKVDAGSGEWLATVNQRIVGLTHAQGLSQELAQNQGESGLRIYLAGLNERGQMGTGFKSGRQWFDPVIFEIDPTSMEATRIYHEESQERDPVLQQIDVKDDLVAWLMEKGNPDSRRKVATVFYRDPETGLLAEARSKVTKAHSLAWSGQRTVQLCLPNGTLDTPIRVD